jgi:putative addiction module component (TIGR02574 family)
MASMDDEEIVLSEEWRAEIDRRLKAFERGEMETYSREEVMRELDADLETGQGPQTLP